MDLIPNINAEKTWFQGKKREYLRSRDTVCPCLRTMRHSLGHSDHGLLGNNLRTEIRREDMVLESTGNHLKSSEQKNDEIHFI